MKDISIKVVTEPAKLEPLASTWDDLAQRSGDDSSIFLTYEWVSSWWHHFGGGNRLNVLVFEKSGEVVGIIPLMIKHYSIGPLTTASLETIGATNDNRIGVISDEHRKEVIESFLSYLKSELTGQSLILRLELVPDDSRFLSVLKQQSPSFSTHLSMHMRTTTLAPYILLPPSWDQYFSSLGRRRRKILLRTLRSFEKTHTVQYKQFPPDSIQEGLNILFELHKKRWGSVNIRSPFCDPTMRQFYRDLSSLLAKKGWLHFSYLSLDGEFASLNYCYVFKRKFLVAICARDLKYSEYSVGHIHNLCNIKEAVAMQLREFDFLRGAEPYKFYWTDKFRRYLQVIIAARKPYGSQQLKCLIGFIRLSEIIQHRHSLKELYALHNLAKMERRERKRMGVLHELK